MTWLGAVTLFVIMLTLAALPSASVALVVTRSVTLGFASGVAVALGIVVGDLLFVALAILGLSLLAETMGAFFAVLKYLGGAYLIWLGIGLLRSAGPQRIAPTRSCGTSLLASAAAGLLLTLGDVKAILFYASLFPVFVDPHALRAADILAICLLTVAAVGGVKLAYAWSAERVWRRIRHRKVRNVVRKGTGAAMVGAGAYLIAKT